MALVKISGPVSNFREETNVKSAQTSNLGYTQVKTEKLINFRVGNRPISMKLPKGIELVDGDEATVVGSDTSGGINAVLVRNDVTGITYGMSTWYVLAWGIVTTLAGLATIAMFVGLLLTPLGLYVLYKGMQLKQAHAIMNGSVSSNLSPV
jgi:hypothetical protein